MLQLGTAPDGKQPLTAQTLWLTAEAYAGPAASYFETQTF